MALGVLVVLAAFGSHLGTQTKSASADVDNVWWMDSGIIEADDDADCSDDGSGNDDSTQWRIADIDPGDVIHVPAGSSVLLCVLVSDDDNQLTLDSNEVGKWDPILCFDGGNNPVWADSDDGNCDQIQGEGDDQVHIDSGDGQGAVQDLDDGILAEFDCPVTGGLATINIDHDQDQFGFFIWCQNNPATTSTIGAIPTTVEIVRAPGNVSHSLITLTLTDAAGVAALPGSSVDIETDRCALSDRYVNNEGDFESVETMYKQLKKHLPITADVIEGDDSSQDHNPGPTGSTAPAIETTSFPVTGPAPFFAPRTIAAAILHCEDPSVVAGVATITARIHVPGPDIVKSVQVTVVGPPFNIQVSVDKASVICGERVTVTAKITDTAGQPVSDHTLAEAISNLGSVLGGTGAVAHFSAPVTPISSTVAETFSGIVTFYLLTSDTQDGLYEIVVTSGGMGSLSGFWSDDFDFEFQAWTTDFNVDHIALGGFWSTPPISGFAQTTCSQPAPAAPAISGPATGTGPLRAPNTGDAGLADSGSSSLMLLAAAAIAFALSGVAVAKFARR